MYDLTLLSALIVFLAMIVFYARQPSASLVHPATFYLAFHGLVFVVRPLLARFYGYRLVYETFHFYPSVSDKIIVIAGSTLAMVVFVLVSLRFANAFPMRRNDALHASARKRLSWPIVLVGIALLPLAGASLLEAWSTRASMGGNMTFDAATGALVNTESNGWFNEAANMLGPVTVLLVWLSRYRLWGWAIFIAFAAAQAGTGGRGNLVFAFAAIAVLYLIEKNRRWFDWRVPVIVGAALLSFNAIVRDRGAGVREFFGGEAGEEVTKNDDLAPLEHMDFANMEFFEYLVYVVPQRSGSWDYFAINLQIFTEPVPRMLWKDKPIGSPVKFFELWDYGTPIGMTGSLPGIGWMSFGWLGIIIQASFFAWLYGATYRWLMLQRHDIVAQLAYAIVLASAIVTFRDGSILTLLRLLPFYLGPLLLVVVVSRFIGASAVHRPGPATASPAPHGPVPSPTERRRALAERAQTGTGRRAVVPRLRR